MTAEPSDTITDKQAFIAALDHFCDTEGRDTPDGYGRIGMRTSHGETTLMRGLARYLENPAIPAGDRYTNWFTDLPAHLVDAFVAFRSLGNANFAELRTQYLKETGHDIPDLLDLRAGRYDRAMVVYDLIRLMPVLAAKVTGHQYSPRLTDSMPWLRQALDGYLNAQANVITHAWRSFIRTCYRPMAKAFKAQLNRGNKGVFGTTTLMSYVLAGRFMFTFQRGDDSDHQVSFVGDDSDLYGFRSGLNFPSVSYAEAVAMIEEVVAHWDPVPHGNGIPARFHPDDQVGLG